MNQSRQHARIAAKLKKASRLIAEGLKAHGEAFYLQYEMNNPTARKKVG
jgi:hypothetical protein